MAKDCSHMPQKLRFSLSALLLVLLISLPNPAKADAMRDFVVSASYGVLAGTLVGAATLAFTDQPGDNLNRIARGASIGLYAGMLLGAYILFGVPGPDDDYALSEPPRFQITPLVSFDRGLEGAHASWSVFRF
jgi:hypothetical protein